MTTPYVPLTEVLGWYAVGPKISVTGIASAEAFGTLVVAHPRTVVPVSIVSAEAFGTATVTVT